MSTAAATLLQARDLVRHSNPVPHAALRDASASPAAQALLRDITSGQRGPLLTAAALAPAPARQAGPGRRWVLAGAAVAGLTAAGVLVRLPGSGTAVAEVPPVLPYALPQGQPAGPVLERIAAAAEALPASKRRRYAYVRTDGWYLSTAVAGGASTSALASTQSETWTAADGRGRSRQVRGPVEVGIVGSRETLDAVLGPPDGGGDGVSERVFGEDGLTLFPPVDVATLPWADPQAWADAVHRHHGTGIPVPVDVVEGVPALFGEQPLQPADRARTWRLVASLPGVADRGPTTDRLGRPGRAITLDDDGSAHGLPVQHLLVVDEVTGQLLEADQVLTTDAGELGLTLPAVQEITVVVSAGWVDDDEQRPAATS
ncbi:CU044_5270 family protein [Quadrisphaera setariae]|uniref:Uncharacterized protein n=1 Tax=Quadrisphaera setariae TaxID=2593304 RepID=A0A5C8ZCC6_9ACTN|nr:CU044_5270 family protein [Quadrisphaera setariae]TXR55542.1 hypothetical protein FMM08_14700 [Quadrisphaera setariae]